MARVLRFGVSLEAELLREVDHDDYPNKAHLTVFPR